MERHQQSGFSNLILAELIVSHRRHCYTSATPSALRNSDLQGVWRLEELVTERLGGFPRESGDSHPNPFIYMPPTNCIPV